MPRFLTSPNLINHLSISTLTPDSIGIQLAAASASFAVSNGWPVTSIGLFVPVEILYPTTVAKMLLNNGTIVAGSVDVGVYDPSGVRQVSYGSTPQSGTSAIQVFDITDTLLKPGLYYMGVAHNNTGSFAGFSAAQAVDLAPLGIFTMPSAFPLPAQATFQIYTGTFVPLVSMTPRVTV